MRNTYFMKHFIYIIIAILSCSSAYSYQITATIVFENLTEKTSISGMFIIPETNQKFEIKSLDKFTIELPKPAKYEFQFQTEEGNALICYPARITNLNNIITIRLENKAQDGYIGSNVNPVTITEISEYNTQQMEDGVAYGTINFIVHGLLAPDPEKIKAFKKSYGVGYRSENCVVDPISFKVAMSNNKKIEAYLTSKFGDDWKIKLPAQPFGL